MQSSIWVEKYRPSNVEEYITHNEVKDTIARIYKSKTVPNMTLYSPKAGSGKTSLAKMLAKDFCDDDEVLFINGSLDRNIDTIRNEMTDFVYKPTLSGNKKIIILDEADGLNKIAQDSLRGFIEQWSNECSFILTCNEIAKIIPAIISRCPSISLTIPSSERPAVAKQIFDRCTHILRDNLIEFDEVTLKNIIKSNFPDIRQTINVLQRLSLSGRIENNSINLNIIKGDNELREIETAIIDKDWSRIRNWCHENSNSSNIYNILYNDLVTKIDKEDVGIFVILTGEYSYRASVSNYSEINLAAYISELTDKVRFNV